MGANCIEIPVARVDVITKSTGQRLVSLTPDYIGPYTEESLYADNKPYVTTNVVTILFKKRQDLGYPMNLADWHPINELIKRGDAVFRLITSTSFEDIDLDAKQLLYNKFIDMFEFRGTITKEEEK